MKPANQAWAVERARVEQRPGRKHEGARTAMRAGQKQHVAKRSAAEQGGEKQQNDHAGETESLAKLAKKIDGLASGIAFRIQRMDAS